MKRLSHLAIPTLLFALLGGFAAAKGDAREGRRAAQEIVYLKVDGMC